MFSPSEALLSPQRWFKGWHLMVRCDRCGRQTALKVPPPRSPLTLLSAFVARVKCGKCRTRPSAAMLTNLRDISRLYGWGNSRGASRFCSGHQGTVRPLAPYLAACSTE